MTPASVNRALSPVHGSVSNLTLQPAESLLRIQQSGWKTVSPGIQSLPTGTFRVRVTAGAGRRITIGTFETLQEARAMYAASMDRLADSRTRTFETMATYLPVWLERRQKAGVRSIQAERNRTNKHILPSKLGTDAASHD